MNNVKAHINLFYSLPLHIVFKVRRARWEIIKSSIINMLLLMHRIMIYHRMEFWQNTSWGFLFPWQEWDPDSRMDIRQPLELSLCARSSVWVRNKIKDKMKFSNPFKSFLNICIEPRSARERVMEFSPWDFSSKQDGFLKEVN